MLDVPPPHHLLLPTMKGILDRMQRAQRVPMHELPPAKARAFYEVGAEVLDVPRRQLARDHLVSLPMRDGHALPGHLWAPVDVQQGEPLPVLVFFHGGGYTVGSVRTHASLCSQLAADGHCAVLSVDYRLAPEHPFPQAVHDAWDAVLAVVAHAREWGLDATRLAVGGDSAGGTLAAVTALMARDAGLPMRLQLLFYPGTCAQQEFESHQRFAHGFLLDKASIDYFFDHYLPDKTQREHWWFAPLNAPSVDDVAPCWMGLAECDPLVDEGLAYADRLRMAGVPVELELYRGVVHEFIKMGRAIEAARHCHQHAAQALRQAFAPD